MDAVVQDGWQDGVDLLFCGTISFSLCGMDQAVMIDG